MFTAVERLSPWLARFPLSLILLAGRVGVGATFFKAGLLKYHSWEFTVKLFQDEYQLPLLDPSLAAVREEALGQTGHEEAIVPLAIELSAGRRILVVTGPNAGGKTVSLKTTGVLALMAMCGLPIPAAAGSRLPFLTRLVPALGPGHDPLAD